MSEVNTKDSFGPFSSPEDVDQAFSEVFDLPESERGAIADAFERAVISSYVETFKQNVRQHGPDVIKKMLRESFNFQKDGQVVYGPDATEVAQTIFQMFKKIEELKGDNASPLVKAFNTAAKDLTPEEYSSTEAYIMPMIAVVDAINKGEIRPNPFHRNDTGAPRI